DTTLFRSSKSFSARWVGLFLMAFLRAWRLIMPWFTAVLSRQPLMPERPRWGPLPLTGLHVLFVSRTFRIASSRMSLKIATPWIFGGWLMGKRKMNNMHRKLRMGMIGGGEGAFIGSIHRTAARMDGQIELVCGAFSSDPEKSRKSGEALYLPPDRVYGSYGEMIQQERELPEGERMDFVAIVTPNHVHFDPAKQALQHGFHVVMDKPMTFDVEEARRLKQLVDDTELTFCLTHAYTGYPMIKEARQMIAGGAFGEIRKIYVEYPQGWLSAPLEQEGNKQA